MKSNGKYTWNDIANISGIPETTLRKIFSGETADPRFDTVAKIVTALGGSLDDVLDKTKKGEQLETNTIFSLKEVYEDRIKDLKEHNASLKKDKTILAIVAAILTIVLAGVLIVDIFIAP
ncbi:MAG: helix-turn-helix transcriptional regulator [Clostridia bacterium]|nr:helix-turn-helix transcriptional regulator [Clostridia bacterium]